MELSETVLITHRNCLDGSACALAFLAAGGREENIRFGVPGRTWKLFEAEASLYDRRIIMADIAPSDDGHFDTLRARCPSFEIVDHHKTNIERFGNVPGHMFDVGSCGSLLLWRRLHDMWWPPPEFYLLVDMHDRWTDDRHGFDLALDLALVHNFHGQSEFIRLHTERTEEQGFSFLKMEETILPALRRRRDDQIRGALARMRVIDISFPEIDRIRIGYVVSTDDNISLLGHIMLDENPSIDVACQLNPARGVSLRSRKGGFDVTRIVDLVPGGGGHAESAGCPINPDVWDGLIGDIMGYDAWRVRE